MKSILFPSPHRVMIRLAPAAVVLVLAVLPVRSSAQEPVSGLSVGLWHGTLTPMNHPDVHTPLDYRVTRDQGVLAIVIVGPGGMELPTEDVEESGRGVAFVFLEPEANVPLGCELTREEDGLYQGRCTDPDGKWALLTMQRDPEAVS